MKPAMGIPQLEWLARGGMLTEPSRDTLTGMERRLSTPERADGSRERSDMTSDAIVYVVEVLGFEGASWRNPTRPIMTSLLGALLIAGMVASVYFAPLRDFFDFVDMTENYPFTGAGNLYRFCQGLARIRIQNRILVVLDNDDRPGRGLTHARYRALVL